MMTTLGTMQAQRYVFYRNGQAGLKFPKLTPSDGNYNGTFGFDLAISGNYIISGALEIMRLVNMQEQPIFIVILFLVAPIHMQIITMRKLLLIMELVLVIHKKEKMRYPLME